MKKTIVALFLVAFAGTAFAAAPESVVMKNSKGDVTFPHKKHQDAGVLKDCKFCHEDAAGGKIAKLGMKKGHDNCKTCHTTGGKGPTACADCHKK